VIEADANGVGSGDRDTSFSLTDVADIKNSMQAGDTSYEGNGLYSFGGGVFGLGQTGNGKSTAAYKEYRLTLSGTSLKLERGDTLATITETITRTLASSIVGKTFYLTIGTGGPIHCPSKSRFDWVSVSTHQ
jgi:hypothetical protein